MIFFYGVRVIRSKVPAPKSNFAVRTIFSDWYLEIGKITDVPVRISVRIENLSRRNITDLLIRVLGMREDYHQDIVRIKATYEVETKRDKHGNIYHIMSIPLLKKRSSITVEIEYNIITRPYRIDTWSAVDLEFVKEEFLKSQPYQKHTAQKIQKIAASIRSSDTMITIKNAVLWVLKNVKYEKTYRRYSVTDTLSRRRGSCLSIADLLVAILRSLNIPARVVRGLYLNRLHAWVEAYVERESKVYVVPIDPLAGIIGALGSIWISHHAEFSTRQKEVEIDSSDVRWTYSIVIEYP